MKADLAIYTHVLGVPGQYESVALMLSHKMDFNCCANRDGFRKSSHIFVSELHIGILFVCSWKLLLRIFIYCYDYSSSNDFAILSILSKEFKCKGS